MKFKRCSPELTSPQEEAYALIEDKTKSIIGSMVDLAQTIVRFTNIGIFTKGEGRKLFVKSVNKIKKAIGRS